MVRMPFIIGLAAVHLILVASGSLKLELGKIPVVGPTLAYYGSLSGAKAGYGFFAPEITGQAGAEFEIIDAAGNKQIVPLVTPANHEVQVRVVDTVEQFAGVYMSSAVKSGGKADEETRRMWRNMAASLCGTVMSRHPEAREVVFRLKNYTPVTMEDYRRGARPQWSKMYEARFRRAAT